MRRVAIEQNKLVMERVARHKSYFTDSAFAARPNRPCNQSGNTTRLHTLVHGPIQGVPLFHISQTSMDNQDTN